MENGKKRREERDNKVMEIYGKGETEKLRNREKEKQGDEEMVTGKMGKWKNPEVGWIHGEMGNFCYE